MTDPSDGFERRPRIAAAGWDGAVADQSPVAGQPPLAGQPSVAEQSLDPANWRCSDASPGSPERC